MNIHNSIVLVSGASSGIGAAIAKSLARAGAMQLVLLGRNETALCDIAGEIAGIGARAYCYCVDLSDAQAVQTITQKIRAEVGVPDILINNAGSGQWKFLEDTAAEEIHRMMAVPYFAAAWLTQAFLPDMLMRGHGHIVNISSVASRLAWPGATAYIAACRAMKGLSDALRADLCGTGVDITHYESGPIATPYWRNNPGSRERVPKIARWLVPILTQQRVANAVVDAVQHKRRLIVIPLMMQLVYLLNYLAPWLVRFLMTGTGYHHPPRTKS